MSLTRALSALSPPRRGDNTYSNYAEANRAFWRQTVLPLVHRTANALARWLGPAWGSEIALRADLDQIEALSPEREALWARLEKAGFLTDDEKRAAVGYGGKGEVSDGNLATKYRPDQPRDDRGRWVEDGGGEGERPDDDESEDPLLVPVAKRGGIPRAALKWAMRQLVSTYCKGKINSELPGEFFDATIEDIMALAKGGDAAARECMKLLKEPRFRK